MANSSSGVHQKIGINRIPDISCNSYNAIIDQRIQHIGLSAEFLRNDPEIGWVRPAAFSARPGINKGDPWSAGAAFNTGFPSQCFTCIITNPPPTGNVSGSGGPGDCKRNPNIGINQILLAKKNYVLQNSKGNVISGEAAHEGNAYKTQARLGGFGGGKTKAEKWRSIAMGRTEMGAPARRYGLQNVSIGSIPNQYSNPHINNWARQVRFSLIPCQARQP